MRRNLRGFTRRGRLRRRTPRETRNMEPALPTPSASPPWKHSMPAWALEAEARLLAGRPARTDRYWADPALILADAGFPPDPWQRDLLRAAPTRTLLLCSRQPGKSNTQAALLDPRALALLLPPPLRQSGELFKDKILRLYNAIGRPIPPVQETALTLTLANGSRVVSLPGEEGTIRGYSGVR